MVTVDGPKPKVGDTRIIAIAFFFGTFISIIAMSTLGLRLPLAPDSASRDESLILALVASLIFAAAVTPLARGIRASGVKRLLTLAAFTYVSFAVINQIEAAVYSTISGTPTMLVVFAPPCLLAAGVASWLVRPSDTINVQISVFRGRSIRAWWWRLLLALLLLPIIEAATGLIIQPLLEPVVEEQTFGLVVPDTTVIIRTLLLKSGLLLAVTVPIVITWTRGRRSLILALGFAVFVLTGLVGLIQAAWWPVTMRIALSLQVLVTSMAYAWAVVALLVPRSFERLNVETSGSS
jgi:hypothetical protein